MAQKQTKKLAVVEEQGYPAPKATAAASKAKAKAQAAPKAAASGSNAASSSAGAASSAGPAALMIMKPTRKARSKKAAGAVALSPEERAWARAKTSTIAEFIWAQRLGDLMLLCAQYGVTAKSRTDAGKQLFLLMNGEEEEEEEEPTEDFVEDDTEEEAWPAEEEPEEVEPKDA